MTRIFLVTYCILLSCGEMTGIPSYRTIPSDSYSEQETKELPCTTHGWEHVGPLFAYYCYGCHSWTGNHNALIFPKDRDTVAQQLLTEACPREGKSSEGDPRPKFLSKPPLAR